VPPAILSLAGGKRRRGGAQMTRCPPGDRFRRVASPVRGRRADRTLKYPCRATSGPGAAGWQGGWVRVAWFRRGAKSQGPTIDRDRAIVATWTISSVFCPDTLRASRPTSEPRTMIDANHAHAQSHTTARGHGRRVPGPDAARRWARGLNVPFYDVALVGYPQRMREYNARQKAHRRAEYPTGREGAAAQPVAAIESINSRKRTDGHSGATLLQ